ncbi:MAG: nitroreductase family protein [Candidatus Thermoplasmatota archaeon]|nr:nitroreductase family protein [Candidatus Thermoplasmatota archaeon]MBU4143686.1 nitroreductase family protein [Candidatus Thermoplasmatota archaeon]MBU4591800.1 nitroreductase family protein [Candidatus Thermoplasmatota archaeon]
MDVMDAIENRRSYRALAPVEITDEMVSKMARATSLAPSCFNKQPWRLIFIRSREMLARMHGALSDGNEWARDGSMLIVVISKNKLDCVIREREYYLFDTGMAIGQLMLMAVEMGLVTHAMAGFSPGKTREILGIPEDMDVVTVIAVGKRSAEKTANISDDDWAVEDIRPARFEFPEYAYQERYS